MGGGGGWWKVATNFNVSSWQGFKLWGLSPWLPSFADPCLTLAWASQLFLQGDSGSPVTYKQGDQHILAGVVNHGNCYNTSVFARVAFHRTNFLDKVLKGATVCKHGVEADDSSTNVGTGPSGPPSSVSCEAGWLDASSVTLGCLYFQPTSMTYLQVNMS